MDNNGDKLGSALAQPSFSLKRLEDDTKSRLVCDSCGWVHYENPKIVVGSVCTQGNKILMCRRAISPRIGFWTLPAGYMEVNETSEGGAKREAMEEACAEIEIKSLLAIYNIPRISQVQLIYRAELVSPQIAPGPESQAVKLVHWEDIPWAELAFPSVHWALTHYKATLDDPSAAPFSNPQGDSGEMPVFFPGSPE